MKKCLKCGKQSPLSNFYRLSDKEANRVGKSHKPVCKSCYKKRQVETRRKRHAGNTNYILKYLKENPCNHCGETDILVLEFNHIGRKKHGIADLLNNGRSLDLIKKEIAKCEVLCANCHKRYTAKQQNNYRYRHLHG